MSDRSKYFKTGSVVRDSDCGLNDNIEAVAYNPRISACEPENASQSDILPEKNSLMCISEMSICECGMDWAPFWTVLPFRYWAGRQE